jgi:hypothetical protein
MLTLFEKLFKHIALFKQEQNIYVNVKKKPARPVKSDSAFRNQPACKEETDFS